MARALIAVHWDMGGESDDRLSEGGGRRLPVKNISTASNYGQAAKSMLSIGCGLGSVSPKSRSGQNRKKEGKKALTRKLKARERSLGLRSILVNEGHL